MKRNLVGKIFGIALVFVMIGAMLGGLSGDADNSVGASTDEIIYHFDLHHPIQVQSPTITEFPICTDLADQGLPAISRDIVVWRDYRNGNHDIYSYNLSSGEEFAVCTHPEEQHWPAISGDIVVWQDERNGNLDIYGYDLSTATEFAICTHSALQQWPAISGNIVVWDQNRDYGTS